MCIKCYISNYILLHYSSSLVVSHSYLCIWVNCCSIFSQVIIYLKVLKRWISILNLALFCSTLPVALLVVDLLPSDSLLLWFAQDLESLCSLQNCLCLDLCCFGLVCLGPRVTLLIVDLSPSQSLLLWFAQHLKLICSLLTCLDSRFQPCVLCVETSTCSACCSVVSGGYLNTLTFVGLVLVSSCSFTQAFEFRPFSHPFAPSEWIKLDARWDSSCFTLQGTRCRQRLCQHHTPFNPTL